MLPLLGTTLTANPVLGVPAALQGVVSLQDNQNSLEDLTQIEQAAKIDAFYKKRDMPLEGYGKLMVKVALDNGLDPYLIPAIAARESSGGREKCKRVPNNPFGWASCKIGFKSMEQAIIEIGAHLGGNNSRTAHYYDNKTVIKILETYNPRSVIPRYPEEVMAIMKSIQKTPLVSDLATGDKPVSNS